MRSTISIPIFLLFTTLFYAQNDSTVYLKTIKYVKKDTVVNYLNKRKTTYVVKEQAFFTQMIVTNPNSWNMILYNKKGELLSNEQFSDYDLTKKFGEQKYYYNSGKLRQIETFNKAEKLEGKYISFYKVGVKKTIGNYKNGVKEGVWDYFYQNESKWAKITYNGGKVSDHKLWTEVGQEKDEPLVYQKDAQFKGGRKDWNNYVNRHLIPKLKSSKYRGRLLVQFTINAEGRPVGIKVRPERTNDRARNSILSFFGSMPNWKPAIELNRSVEMKMTLPIQID